MNKYARRLRQRRRLWQGLRGLRRRECNPPMSLGWGEEVRNAAWRAYFVVL